MSRRGRRSRMACVMGGHRTAAVALATASNALIGDEALPSVDRRSEDYHKAAWQALEIAHRLTEAVSEGGGCRPRLTATWTSPSFITVATRSQRPPAQRGVSRLGGPRRDGEGGYAEQVLAHRTRDSHDFGEPAPSVPRTGTRKSVCCRRQTGVTRSGPSMLLPAALVRRGCRSGVLNTLPGLRGARRATG